MRREKRKTVVYRLMFIICATLLLNYCSSSDSDGSNPPSDNNPTAVDDTLVVEENSVSGASNQINVGDNDSFGEDGANGSDNYSILTSTQNGDLNEISDGVFEYIPNSGYFGNDSFTYQIQDLDGDTDSATVSITVSEFQLSADDFANIDPNFPSFTSLEDTTPDGKTWVKLESMSDEFDVWDSSKWFKSTWHYGVPVFMSASSQNSGVTNGHLWIKATLNNNNPEGRWFQSARIHSVAETSYPMYTEARIRTAHISAYNTYWLNNGNIDNRDEIDIIENNSNPSCSNCTADDFPIQMNSQYFQADQNEVPQTIRNKGNFLRSDLSSVNPLINTGWNEDYHTFGVWWKDSKNIQFYLNGEPAGSVVVGEHQDGNTYDREFTRELEIIFDLWTNEAPWLGGLPPQSDLNDDSINTMRIDWVRTWKLEDE